MKSNIDEKKKRKFIVCIKKLGRNKLDPASKLYSQIYHQGYNTGYQVGERKVCKSLLHQRDNEIREKIQEMRKMHFKKHPQLMYIPYDQALNDLLTYLSNREV